MLQTRPDVLLSLQCKYGNRAVQDVINLARSNNHDIGDLLYNPRVIVRQAATDSQVLRSPGPYEDKWEEFQQFIRLRSQQIDRLSLGTERRTQDEILRRFIDWVQSNSRRRIFLTSRPMDVYEQIGRGVITFEVFQRIERERLAPQDEASRRSKLEEYWDLAYQLWGYRSRSIRSIDIPSEHRAVIIQASTVFQEVLNQLAGQLMDWAHANYHNADFVLSSPTVSLSQIADRPRNRLALALAQTRPVETESVPIPETRRELWQTGVELLVGFIPIIGDLSDVAQAMSGVDIWGEHLGTGDRAVMMLGGIIPFVPGQALRRGRQAGEFAIDLARQTGRHADELMPIIRAAESFRRQDVQLIQSAVDAVRAGHQLSAAQVRLIEEVLQRVSRDLRAPLAGAIRRGGSRVFVEFTEEAIEHVGVRHIPEMFDPRAALRSLNQQGISDPSHITHLFPPGMAPSDRTLTTLMRQAIESREATATAERVFTVSLRGQQIRVVTGAGSGGQGVRLVSMFPASGTGVTRRQIVDWARAMDEGRMSLENVRHAVQALFRR